MVTAGDAFQEPTRNGTFTNQPLIKHESSLIPDYSNHPNFRPVTEKTMFELEIQPP